MLQHGALVDRALVGDLAQVDGRGGRQQAQPRHAGGAARGSFRQGVHNRLEMGQHGRARQHVGQRRVRSQTSQTPHRRRGEHHRAHLLEVQPGNNHVLHIRCPGGDDFGAHRAHADERASAELEVFGNAAIKVQAQVDVVRVNPFDGVAAAKKTFVVKRLAGGFGIAPVARGDVRTFVAHLYLVARVHQLDFQARGGHAQVASLDVRAIHAQRKRAGFGHAQARAHHDALADLALLAGVQRIPDRLRQGGSGIKKHAHPAEQVFAQQVVGFHRLGNHFKAGGHVEVERGGNFAQVAQRLGHACGSGLAFVNVQRAAVGQHHAKVMVAAKGVAPRQPIDQHQFAVGDRRHGLCHLALVGAPHALGNDHRLGHLGRAGGEHEFGEGRWRDGGKRGIDSRRGLGRQKSVKTAQRPRIALVPCYGGECNLTVRRHGGANGFAVACVAGEHQAGRQRGQHMLELAVVAADEGVGG